MNIATALNKKYVLYTIVMLTSLCENNREHVTAYILNSELDEGDIQSMRKGLGAYDITIVPIHISKERFDVRVPTNIQWTLETYYRLFLMDLLPEDVNRLLYLDVDLIVNQSLKELYHTDFQGAEILAAEDACGNPGWNGYAGKAKEMFEPIRQKGHKYFNAGVMLMNIAELRRHYRFADYCKAMEEWDYQMQAPDQDILNYVHWQKIKYIDYGKYDLFARIAHNNGVTYEEVKAHVAIVHFAGDKPWETRNVHYDIEQIWWDYAKLTPHYYELLESFVYLTMNDTYLEEEFRKVMDQKSGLENNLKESLELNQKLLGMIS